MTRQAFQGQKVRFPEELREYRYRQLFGLTHEQYMDEPASTVDWMLAIASIESEEAKPDG